jgi:acyl-CoA dehydrogenase
MQDERWRLTDWPFFEESHRALAARVGEWNRQLPTRPENPTLQQCRALARSLGDAGLLRYVVPEQGVEFDVRALCLIREGLTFEYGIADSMFAMQGIGTLAIQRSGTDEQKSRYLDGCRRGERVAAFALTEPDAGSDVAAMTTAAVRDGAEYVINGAKTLITNAGLADHYIVVARTGEAEGSRGLSAFIVDADTPGLAVGSPIEFMAPHPAGSLTFVDCRIPKSSLIGEAGRGFKVAMAAFDHNRPSVGAAGVGLARRALRETLKRVSSRKLQGKPMGEIQGIQMALADMATDIDTAALAVYRAAWELDVLKPQRSYSPSMAKLCGAEAAGRVVDRAVQLFGGAGVVRGNVIEHLYREARPMRIYEGASEIQKLIIGRQLLADFTATLG